MNIRLSGRIPIFLLVLGLILPNWLRSQCTVKVSVDPIKNYCGSPFNPSALGSASTFVTAYQDAFNNKQLGPGWSTSTAISFENPCGSSDGTPCVWMIGGTDRNRSLVTTDYDVSKGGQVCFDFKMADVNGTTQAPPNCEAPDQSFEGVYLQYSSDGGATWFDIFYFNPAPFPVVQYTSWNSYCFNLPQQALTPATRFRWHQAEASGNDVDHWGIDNVVIKLNDPNFEYIWDHTSSTSAQPGFHTPTTSPFTYRVTYRNTATGVQCSDQVTVETLKPELFLNPTSAVVCGNNAVPLSARYVFPGPNQCEVNPNGTVGNPSNQTLGSGSINTNQLFNNASAGSRKSQFIIRKSELNAIGPATFNGLGLYINSTGLEDRTYYNLRIKIGCTGNSAYSTSNFVTNLSTVFDEQSWSFKNGFNFLPFTESYSWDGLNNLVIEICWSNILIKNDLPVDADDLGWNCNLNLSGNTNSSTTCNATNGGVSSTVRPRFYLSFGRLPNPTVSYQWSPATGLSNATVFNPTASPSSSTTYTVVAVDQNAPQCRASGTVTVAVRTSESSSDTNLVVCRSESPFDIATRISGGLPPGGSWADPLGNASNGIFNPQTSTPGNYLYSVNDPECGVFTTRVGITLETPKNPGIGIDSAVCQTSGALNIFNLIRNGPQPGGTLQETTSSGAFNNPQFVPANTTPGTYVFTYQFGPGAACPAASSTVRVTVTAPPNAGVPTTSTVCNSAGVINLFDRLNGSPQPGGTWTNQSGAGTLSGNNFDVTGLPEGSYNFVYTLPPSNGCAASSTTLTLQVVNQPSAGQDNSIVVCNSIGTVNLFNQLNGTPNAGGFWSDLNNSGAMSPAGVFTVSNVPAGTYNFRYTLSAQGCQTRTANIRVTVSRQNSSGTGRDTVICGDRNLVLTSLLSSFTAGGQWQDTDNSGRLTGAVFNPTGLGSGSFRFTYVVNSAPPCQNRQTTVTVGFEMPAQAGNDAVIQLCKGSNESLFSKLSGNPSPNGKWFMSPPNSALNPTTGVLATQTLDTGTYIIRYAVTGKAPCPNDTSTLTVRLNESPRINNISFTCIDQNRSYLVEFTVSGGQTSSYSFQPTGSVSGTNPVTYRSTAVPSKSSRTFYVNDANGCGPDSLVALIDCGCVSFAGTFASDTLQVCESQVATGRFNNDAVNDGNDTLIYVLHQGSADSLVNPIAFRSTPTFSFAPPMEYYRVYFISSLMANKGAFNGFDQSDSCLQVAPGQPVVFNPNPLINLSVPDSICQGDSLSVVYSLTQGMPPFTLTFGLNGNNASLQSSALTGSFQLPFDQSGVISFIRVVAKGCQSALASSFSVEVEDSIKLSALNFTCNADNNAYQISFAAEGGLGAPYAVVGINTTQTGGMFTSGWLSSGSSYQFSVASSGVCPPISRSGSYTCPCISDAGRWTNTGSIKLCGTDTARPAFDGLVRLDGNDRQQFILHSSNPGIGTVLAVYDEPVFTYFSGLAYGQTYYVSSIAGDSTVDFIDLNDPCLSQSPAIPIVFYPNLSGQLQGDTALCEGQLLNLNPIINGFGPYSVQIKDQAGRTFNFSPVPANGPFVVQPPVGESVYRFQRLRDLSSGCPADTSGFVRVVVNAAPKLTFTTDTSYCQTGDSLHFGINLVGEPPFLVDMALGDSIFQSLSTSSQFVSLQALLPPGEHVFTLRSLRDASLASCPGISTDSLRVEVFPEPKVNLSGQSIVCSGDSAMVPYDITQLYPGYSSTYAIELLEMPSGRSYSFSTTQLNGWLPVLPTDTGQVYTVTRVTDVTSGCVGVAQGLHHASIIQRPQASLRGDTSFCDGPTNLAQLHLTLQGQAPFQVYLSQSTGTPFAVSDTTTGQEFTVERMLPAGTHLFQIDSIVDGSTLACRGIGLGSARITIHPLPDAQFRLAVGEPDTACENDTLTLQIQASGRFPIRGEIKRNGNPFTDVTLTSSAVQPIRVKPPVGNHSFTLELISDGNTPTCSRLVGDTVNLTIIPKPEVNIELVRDTVCSGEPLVIRVSRVRGLGDLSYSLAINGQPAINYTLSGNERLDTFLLPDGLHQFALLNAQYSGSALTCVNTLNSTLFAFIQPQPSVSAFTLQPDTVCLGSNSVIQIRPNQPGDYRALLQSQDSSWTASFTDSLEAPYGPLMANRNVDLLRLEYQRQPTCSQAISIRRSVVVNLPPTLQFEVPSDTVCEGTPYTVNMLLSGFFPITGTLRDPSGTTYVFTANQSSVQVNIPNPRRSGAIQLSGLLTDALGCTSAIPDELQLTVHPLPPVSFAALPPESCEPLETRLINLTNPNLYVGPCGWFINDSLYFAGSCDTTASFSLREAGSYAVGLSLISTEGCPTKLTQTNFLTVNPNPKADFTFTPSPITITNSRVQFIDESTGNTDRVWNFDFLGLTREKNPVITFPADPELTVPISLLAISDKGCADTINKPIKVTGEMLINIPNTFTPDGDGINDVFFPVLVGIEVTRGYELQIFNRWGELIFESQDPTQGWDGTYQMKPVPQGVYTYRVKVNNVYKVEVKEIFGHISVLR
ncbi:MAG TPA: gliding motility-associated C-terminal domain-containing protein [Luteibaculaceae bacterium]|nr:gliding motility-associated C-terminal domain-containing protein [Luteibaculaceae bacterium]